MSEEHDHLFKELGDDLERWLKSVRDWQEIATKSYTIGELETLKEEFYKRPATVKYMDYGADQFVRWLKEMEKP